MVPHEGQRHIREVGLDVLCSKSSVSFCQCVVGLSAVGQDRRPIGCTVTPLPRRDVPFPDKVSSILFMLSQARSVKTCGLMETGSEIYYLL